MRSLVAAELLKLRTTRAAKVAAAVVLAYAVLGPVLVVVAPEGAAVPPIEPSLLAEALRSPARLAGAAVLLIGLLASSLTEFLAENRQFADMAAQAGFEGLTTVEGYVASRVAEEPLRTAVASGADHFDLIDPGSPAYLVLLTALEELLLPR